MVVQRAREPLTWWQSMLIFTSLTSALTAVYSVLTARRATQEVFEAITSPPLYRTQGSPVSVIIPTLNEEDFLPLLLASIHNQTYEPIEIIVADSSTDSTPQIAEVFGASVISVPELNISHARNEGAKAASGEILVICDADCIMAHNFVEKLVDALESGARLAHGIQCIYDSEAHNFISVPLNWIKPRLWTTGRGIAIRKADFFEIGGYSESCDPMRACREDLLFGQNIENMFGSGSVILVRDAMIATSSRRPLTLGKGVWGKRGYRDGVIP